MHFLYHNKNITEVCNDLKAQSLSKSNKQRQKIYKKKEITKFTFCDKFVCYSVWIIPLVCRDEPCPEIWKDPCDSSSRLFISGIT